MLCRYNSVHSHRDDAEMGSAMTGHAHRVSSAGGLDAAGAASFHFQLMSVFVCLGGSLCSACANVCYEWVLKHNSHHSFWAGLY